MCGVYLPAQLRRRLTAIDGPPVENHRSTRSHLKQKKNLYCFLVYFSFPCDRIKLHKWMHSQVSFVLNSMANTIGVENILLVLPV